MDTETSSFETSEMLATFIASTPLLIESWRLCNLANANPVQNFVVEQIGNVGYIAFSCVQQVPWSDPSCRNLVPLACFGPFSPLNRQNEDEEPVMIHAGMLQIFLSMYGNPSFQNQMLATLQKSKSIVITGHSIAGATATLVALWLLSHLQSNSSSISVLCITYGSPLVGNESLSRAILRERWGGNFFNVVSKYDIVPRLLFAPIDSMTPLLHSLLHYWQHSMVPQFGLPAVQSNDNSTAEIFRFVKAYLEMAADGAMKSLFWPHGNYFFCSEEGSICVDNATSVIRMMHLLFEASSPISSIEDHLKYGDYVDKISTQILDNRSPMLGEIPESSYEAGIALALQSTGIACQEPIPNPAKDCLKAARRMGRTPNLNCANLAIKMSKITPYRAEIEWYKASCDQSDDQSGYYDSFKQRGASRRDFKVNMNRHKLAQFWDNVITMLESNQLPHDFLRREKWGNAAQSYKLLVEPLDIAEYYRTGMHRTKGHYISHGRERRYKIFDKWWKDRPVREEENRRRSKFAGLTQDTCFWARVEEAREWLDNVRSERNPNKLALLWEDLDRFERYASELVERKEVSKDVVANNSSYTLWVKDYKLLKSQVRTLHPQFTSFMDEVVP